MTLTTRMFLVLALTFVASMADRALAQETPTDTVVVEVPADGETVVTEDSSVTDTAAVEEGVAGEETAAETTEESPYDLRNRFTSVLQTHPYDLATILMLDPALLSNEAFMSDYPTLQAFVAENPEITRNPHFYLAEYQHRRNSNDSVDDVLEVLSIFATIGLIALALAWLIRTIIEQKRWSRLSKTQSEVHNKILDRFGTAQELIDYVRSPAGAKFLESAPIAVRAEEPERATPGSRLLRSVQIGIVVAAGGLGMMLVSIPLYGNEAEGADGLLAMGAILFCVGGGFIASAFVSLLLSRRLGLWQDPATTPTERLHETEHLR